MREHARSSPPSRTWRLAGLSLLFVAALLVLDHLSCARGELEKEDGSASGPVAGHFSVAWHRVHLGLFDGQPDLDLRDFKVCLRADHDGRQLDFRPARGRFGPAIVSREGGDAQVVSSLLVDLRCVQDPGLFATVEVVRTIRQRRTWVFLDSKSGRHPESATDRRQSMEAWVQLKHSAPGGNVIVARGHGE